jgi:DNA repair protein RecO (recombination protein O)
MLQPLTLLNMVVYHHDQKNLQRVREMSFDHIFSMVPFDIVRSSMAMFITEVLNKTLQEQTSNEHLFDFIHGSIRQLDAAEVRSDFHVFFLARLSALLGFAPSSDKSVQPGFFDLLEGSYVREDPGHYHTVPPEDAQAFAELFADTQRTAPIERQQRNRLLDDLLIFFRLHVEGFGQLKSHKILQAVLN